MPPPFSARTAWPKEPNRWSEAVERRRRGELAVLDLTVSNPTVLGLAYAREPILESLADPRALLYAPDPLGMPEARAALARHLGPAIPPDHLVLSASTSEAYAWLWKLLCDRGDQVLVPEPSYPLLGLLAELEDVELVPYRLLYGGGWRIDMESLRNALGSRTRAIVVIHPNNPTGNLVTVDDVRSLRAVASERGLALISDEVFLDFVWESADRARSLAWWDPGATDETPLTFALGGLSKSAGLPQLKLAWIHVAGAAPSVAEALRRMEILADSYLSVSTPVQLALPSLLASRAAFVSSARARCRENLATLDRLVESTPLDRLVADGGWSAVLRVPATRTGEEWALALLEGSGVIVHPGELYEFRRGSHLVVSLLAEPAVFEEGARCLVSAVQARA